MLTDDGPKWLSTLAAARYLGITTRTLYRLIDEGAVPAYKMGRVLRLQRGELEAFLEGRRVKPGELSHLIAPRRSPVE